jgi:phage tail P2-like protein
MNSVLATSVAKDHIAVFEQIFAEQLANVDISTVLMNMIDTCPAQALPYLAVQFDVEGYKGMRWAITEQEQRNLIKKAIELHRYKGTPWAVAESLKVLGYNDVEINDHLEEYIYDGTYDYNGTIYYGSPHWAMFRVIIFIADNFEWTADLYPDIVILVNEYKNTRSHLLDISAGLRISDKIITSDILAIPEIGYIVSDSFASLIYNGVGNYNGTYSYQNETDELTITII